MALPAMIRRSGKVCVQSGPTARECNFCSQIVHTLATAEIRANGASTGAWRQRIFPRSHQIQSASTNGSITTEGLLSVARMKKNRDEAKTNEQRSPGRRWGSLEGTLL